MAGRAVALKRGTVPVGAGEAIAVAVKVVVHRDLPLQEVLPQEEETGDRFSMLLK